MKICICDNDSFSVGEIRRLLEEFRTEADSFEISHFSDGKELLEFYKKGGCFDILFIDTDSGDTNGIEVAERIKELSPETIIIFVSNLSDYVFEAFRIEALHFLVKPVKEKEFSEVFTRAMKKHTSTNARVILKWESVRNNILINEISFVEGYHRHLIVHTAKGVYESVGKITEIYEILRPHGFIRVHQGFIVNMNYIKSFNVNEIELTDGSRVAISVRKRPEALKAYDVFVSKWSW